MDIRGFEDSGKSKFHFWTAACTLCVAALATALPAHAGGRIGWVLASEPTTASYIPATAYSYNSRFDNNTVTRSGTGAYEVIMAGLYSGTEAGNAQVTAYNSSGYCTSNGWGHSGMAVTINVLCFNASGAAADTEFTAMYQSHSGNSGTPSKGVAFVLNADASASNTPSANVSYNSLGKTNTITHNSTGNYSVKVPGLTAEGGDVQITAVGSVAGRCKVLDWGYLGDDETTIGVLCYDSTGAHADEQFSLSYSLGEPYALGTPQTNYQAYAWADKATDRNDYTPDGPYDFSNLKTGRLKAQKTGTGTYTVTIPGTLPAYSTSNILVTAYGGADGSYCNVASWATSTINVACYSTTGAPENDEFDVSFQAWE